MTAIGDIFPCNVTDIAVVREAARAAMVAGQWNDAAAAWERLRALEPNGVDAFVLGAEAAKCLGRLEEAEALALDASRRFPDVLWALHNYAGMAGYREDWEEALRRWEAVLSRFPNDPGTVANVANALTKVGRSEDAVPHLRWLVEHHPDQPDGWIGLGEQAMRDEHWEEAIRIWDEVRERFPNLSAGWGFSVESMAAVGRLGEADSLAREGVASFPNDLWLAHIHATLPLRHNDLAEAADRWTEVRNLFPDDPTGYEFGARTLRDSGRTEEAKAIYGQAALRFPHRADAFISMAELAMERGEWEDAVLLWADLRRRFPRIIKGYLQGVSALRHAGLSAEADILAGEGDELFRDSLDLALMHLEAELDATLAPDMWELWCRCETLGGRAVPHFFTLSWRVYLLLCGQPRSVKVLDALLSEPVFPGSDAVPSLIRGLAWCLQSSDRRFAAVHYDISRHLGSTSGQGLQPMIQVLLGLAAPDSVVQMVWERLRAPPAKLTRVLFSSFEGHQAAAAGAISGVGAALRTTLAKDLADIGNDALIPTPNMAFNMLFFAYSLDTTFFLTAADILRRFLQRSLPQSGDVSEVWAAVGKICDAAVMPPTKQQLRQPAAVSRRLRIAFCISGQLRGFRTARATWHRLGLDRHDVTTVVHVWRNIGRQEMALANEQRGFPAYFVRKYNLLVLQVGLQKLRARFPRFYAAFTERSDVTEAELRSVYGTKHVVVEDEAQEPFSTMTNAMKMYYKVQAAHDLVRSIGGEFDVFIRFRPDREVAAGDMDWRQLWEKSCRDRTVFCDYGPVITPMGDLIFGDQFAAGCGETMDVYSRTWGDARSALARQFGYARQFEGHVNFVSNLLYQGVTAAGVQGVQFGRLFDPDGLPLSRLHALAESDAAKGPADEIAELFLAAFNPTCPFAGDAFEQIVPPAGV